MTATPELPVVETADALEIESPMLVGKRILFFLLGLFPLIAPYELLLKPRWTGYANVFFLFAAAISLGALSVTAFFVFAAVAGIRSRMRFDRARGLFTYTASAPAMGTHTSRCPLDAIAAIEIQTHEWSDGAPSYSLNVVTKDQRTFRTSSAWSKEEVEALKRRARVFLGRPAGPTAGEALTPLG
ncbi:MAG: hypothetical protein IPL89_12015 [Acidobacteria bacterium]|nr:hypothetical protein [Acidobacteriota bacterium]